MQNFVKSRSSTNLVLAKHFAQFWNSKENSFKPKIYLVWDLKSWNIERENIITKLDRVCNSRSGCLYAMHVLLQYINMALLKVENPAQTLRKKYVLGPMLHFGWSCFTIGRNELVCLSLVSLSSLAYYLRISPGAYPRVQLWPYPQTFELAGWTTYTARTI